MLSLPQTGFMRKKGVCQLDLGSPSPRALWDPRHVQMAWKAWPGRDENQNNNNKNRALAKGVGPSCANCQSSWAALRVAHLPLLLPDPA